MTKRTKNIKKKLKTLQRETTKKHPFSQNYKFILYYKTSFVTRLLILSFIINYYKNIL